MPGGMAGLGGAALMSLHLQVDLERTGQISPCPRQPEGLCGQLWAAFSLCLFGVMSRGVLMGNPVFLTCFSNDAELHVGVG